jgi:hypothetical protein
MTKCKIYCLTLGQILDGSVEDDLINVFLENGDLGPYSELYDVAGFEIGLGSFCTEAGNWGIFSRKNSQVLIKAEWDYALPFGPEVVLIKRGDKFGLVDIRGKVLVEPVWDKLEHHPPNMIVQRDGLFGVIDGDGRIVIDTVWHEIKRLKSSGIPGRLPEFAVRQGRKWGLYDTSGKLILEPLFDEILMSAKVLACDEKLSPLVYHSVIFGQKATSNVFVTRLGHIINPTKDLFDAKSLSWFYIVFNNGHLGIADTHGQIAYDKRPYDKNAPIEPPSSVKNTLVWTADISTDIGRVHLKLWHVPGPANWDAKLYFSVQKDLKKQAPPVQKKKPAGGKGPKMN